MTETTETVNFPVTQSILPWTFNFNFGQPNSYGPMTVALGSSRNARLERTIVDAVGSYGRQIGRIGEALGIVLDELERLRGPDAPVRDERAERTIRELRRQLETVANIKAMQGEA